jgi:MFS family permease
MANTDPSGGATVADNGSVQALLALMLAVFTVSAGYGVMLPLLPYVVEQMTGDAGVATVSRHTGLLTAVYTISLFLFASRWGRLSDRFGRRRVILIGLLGFAVSMLVFAGTADLAALYAERFLSGLFAAAVTPVALATVGDLVRDDAARARRLTMVGLAGVSGFLLGPMLGVMIARMLTEFPGRSGAATSLAAPMAAAALLALGAALAAMLTLPRTRSAGADTEVPSVAGGGRSIPVLLGLAFVVAAAIGVFEVGLALRGKQELALAPYQIASMFTECSLVMFAAQALVFSPWTPPQHTRWLIAPALALLVLGLLLVSAVSSYTGLLIAVAATAAGGGVLSPILTYWISTLAGTTQGAELGRQTAATSLGQAVGSSAGGLLFGSSLFAGAPLVIVAAGATLASVRLPARLDQARPSFVIPEPSRRPCTGSLVRRRTCCERSPRRVTTPLSLFGA